MKAWNFKVKSNTQEIIKKLGSKLGSVNGFVFNMDHDKKDSILFNFRKRVLYPDQISHRNRIIINGKILKTTIENETDVEISFTQHFLIALNIFIFWGLGLLAIIFGTDSSASMYLPGGILFAIGIAFWIVGQRKFKIQDFNF